IPSIWRASGEPITRRRKASRGAVSCGRSSAKQYPPSGAPPRLHMPRTPWCSSRGGVSDILQALLSQPFAQLVNVEPALAGSKTLALLFLVGDACLGLGSPGLGLLARNNADAVVIGHDHIAGTDVGAGADDGHVDRAKCLLDGPLREDRL